MSDFGRSRSMSEASSAGEAPSGAVLRIAVIPARGGSKRIPGKNIRSFLGKPAIAYSIAAAQRSGLFDRIVVSTDCGRIAEIAESYGAEVPFLRPPALADDHCGILPVFRHAIAAVQRLREELIRYACCIYPTAVLLSELHLIAAYHRLAAAPSIAYCFTVCPYEHPIERALSVTESGTVSAVAPEHAQARTQNLPAHYYDAGQFYWARADAALAGAPIFCGPSLPYVLRHLELIDIDDADDWRRAEAIATALGFEARQEELPRPARVSSVER